MPLEGKDREDATNALLNWLESQDIDCEDGVMVLTTALVACIHAVSMQRGLDAAKGGRVISKIIAEALK